MESKGCFLAYIKKHLGFLLGYLCFLVDNSVVMCGYVGLRCQREPRIYVIQYSRGMQGSLKSKGKLLIRLGFPTVVGKLHYVHVYITNKVKYTESQQKHDGKTAIRVV